MHFLDKILIKNPLGFEKNPLGSIAPLLEGKLARRNNK